MRQKSPADDLGRSCLPSGGRRYIGLRRAASPKQADDLPDQGRRVGHCGNAAFTDSPCSVRGYGFRWMLIRWFRCCALRRGMWWAGTWGMLPANVSFADGGRNWHGCHYLINVTLGMGAAVIFFGCCHTNASFNGSTGLLRELLLQDRQTPNYPHTDPVPMPDQNIHEIFQPRRPKRYP